jgi:hypothetical protein
MTIAAVTSRRQNQDHIANYRRGEPLQVLTLTKDKKVACTFADCKNHGLIRGVKEE